MNSFMQQGLYRIFSFFKKNNNNSGRQTVQMGKSLQHAATWATLLATRPSDIKESLNDELVEALQIINPAQCALLYNI